MTDQDLLEDRLRRTFDAVADRAVASTGRGTGSPRSLHPSSSSSSSSSPSSTTSSPSSWSTPSSRGSHGRRLLVGAVAALVLVAGFALALAYGPRSANPRSPGRTPTATRPPAAGPADIRLVYRPVTPASATTRRKIASVMDARLRDVGARDVKVSVAGGDIHVSARVSGDDVTRDRSLVGAAGVISFRPVDCMAPPYSPAADPGRTTKLPACGAAYLINRVDAQSPGVVKPDPAFTSYPSTTPAQADRDLTGPVLQPTDPASLLDHTRLVLGPTELRGSDVAGATAMGINGRWSVNLDFTGRGATRLDEFEFENFHRMIGVDLDGAVLVTAPIEPNQAAFTSAEGRFTFGANFSAAEAIDLDVLLNHRSLPARVKLISSMTVGAGLNTRPN